MNNLFMNATLIAVICSLHVVSMHSMRASHYVHWEREYGGMRSGSEARKLHNRADLVQAFVQCARKHMNRQSYGRIVSTNEYDVGESYLRTSTSNDVGMNQQRQLQALNFSQSQTPGCHALLPGPGSGAPPPPTAFVIFMAILSGHRLPRIRRIPHPAHTQRISNEAVITLSRICGSLQRHSAACCRGVVTKLKNPGHTTPARASHLFHDPTASKCESFVKASMIPRGLLGVLRPGWSEEFRPKCMVGAEVCVHNATEEVICEGLLIW